MRQERTLDDHENEWKSTSNQGEEVGSMSRTRQRPEVREAPRIAGFSLAVAHSAGESEEAASCSQAGTPVDQ